MPLYTYYCDHCKSEFTELRRFSEIDSPIECLECGSGETQRILSGFAVGIGTSSTMETSLSGNNTFH